MSKHVNMTGHYKVAGRDRQGEGILQSSQKGAYAQQRQEARREAIEAQAGPPAWEVTPPNLEITDEPKPAVKKPSPRKGRKNARTRTAKTTRKATMRKKVGRVAAKGARRPSAASKRSRRTRSARS